MTSDNQHIDAHHHRRAATAARTIGGALAARAAVMDFRGIEFARGGWRAWRTVFVFGSFIDGNGRGEAKALALCAGRHVRRVPTTTGPKASMIAEAMMPRPGAANGVVPKKRHR